MGVVGYWVHAAPYRMLLLLLGSAGDMEIFVDSLFKPRSARFTTNYRVAVGRG